MMSQRQSTTAITFLTSVNPTQHRARQNGFTLIEVLIAGLLMAIGILGHMSMQATNLEINRAGLYHSKASQLANDIADRMQANPQGVIDGYYDLPLSSPLTANPNASPPCVNCNTYEDIAKLDKHDWQSDMRTLPFYESENGTRILPQATIVPVANTNPGTSRPYNSYEITVSWPVVKDIRSSDTQDTAKMDSASVIVGFAS